nr:cobalamin biosynthesis protein CobW [uncultured Neokomagataea sp.]
MTGDKRASGKIPVTVVTGFLGAGKTTLLRHVLTQPHGRRIAVIVNEFGSLGIDGSLLRSCGIEGCRDEDIVELANGCLCCTVADDFLPTMQALIDRDDPPEHVVIETSGLALPKPLLKAFGWPGIRTRMTVDGVVTLVDGPAFVEGRFADDPEAVAAQRAADPSLDHDNPLVEVFEDQLASADLVVLGKTDLMTSDAVDAAEKVVQEQVARFSSRHVPVLKTSEGRIDASVLLGIGAAAEDDLSARPSSHDGADDHEHDDFDSFVVTVPEQTDVSAFVAHLKTVAGRFDLLRIKGFVPVTGKARRLAVQGVGTRFRHEFDAPRTADLTEGQLVVIGRHGLDRAAIEDALKTQG